MARVLIADEMSARAAETFRRSGVEADMRPGLSADELAACIDGYDGLAVRSATRVTARLLEAGTALRVVGRAGIGVDNIDVAAASGRGVVVMNTPFGNAITTAEHAIALILALARHIPAADASTQAGGWERSRFLGVELTGKTLGIVGCGNVGAAVAERALGLRMRVAAHDPYLSPERAAGMGVEKVDLDALYARSDFITLHTPLTEETRGMIDAAALSRMAPGVRIVNCARGELVVEADMKAALESGRVGGFAVDVYAEEPPRGYGLFGLPNVIATPHLGASTAEAQEKVAAQIAEQMSAYLTDGAVVNAVNLPSLTAEEAPRLIPYMSLAQQLGSFAGQVAETSIRAVAVEYEGQVARLSTRPLTACVLQGLLSPVVESVNMVSAPIVAREREIEVSEVRHDRAAEYQTLIRLTLTTERRKRTFAGTLFGGDKPRIVDLDGITLEAELGPCMLYTINRDRPGYIGRLGSLLGDAGVNIATFHLGRTSVGGEAVALLGVDGSLPSEVVRQVRAFDDVVQARALRF